MWIDTTTRADGSSGVSLQDFDDWRRASRTFVGMTLVQTGRQTISADDRLPEAYPGGYHLRERVRSDWREPVLGRGFLRRRRRTGRAAGRVDQRRHLEIAVRVRSRCDWQSGQRQCASGHDCRRHA